MGEIVKRSSVAVLACLGMLLAGCSNSSSVSGPADVAGGGGSSANPSKAVWQAAVADLTSQASAMGNGSRYANNCITISEEASALGTYGEAAERLSVSASAAPALASAASSLIADLKSGMTDCIAAVKAVNDALSGGGSTDTWAAMDESGRASLLRALNDDLTALKSAADAVQ